MNKYSITLSVLLISMLVSLCFRCIWLSVEIKNRVQSKPLSVSHVPHVIEKKPVCSEITQKMSHYVQQWQEIAFITEQHRAQLFWRARFFELMQMLSDDQLGSLLQIQHLKVSAYWPSSIDVFLEVDCV